MTFSRLSSSVLPAFALTFAAVAAPSLAHADPVAVTSSGEDEARWSADADDAPLAPRATVAPVATRPKSVPRRTTGQVLTILGIAHLVAGSAVMGYFFGLHDCEFCALGGIIIGAPIAGTGVALTSVGIPLWATGAREVPVNKNAPALDSAYVPRLELGPGSFTLSGSF
jgi:hypothetical protein